jgi:hypothetical protein
MCHIDLTGPYRTTGRDGEKYMLTIVDNTSSYSTVYFRENKSSVSKFLQDYIAFSNRITGKLMKKVRTDNGGEFINNDFMQFAANEGIEVETTAPYTSMQNGKAERMHRTLFDSGRSMLHESGLPLTFWPEALATANYLRNRCHSAVVGKTPFELFRGFIPDISGCRIFGSQAWMMQHDVDKNQGKLDLKSVPGYFVGYPAMSKGYLFWNPATDKIMTSRDVMFDESKIMSQSFHTSHGSVDFLEEPTRNQDITNSSVESSVPQGLSSFTFNPFGPLVEQDEDQHSSSESLGVEPREEQDFPSDTASLDFYDAEEKSEDGVSVDGIVAEPTQAGPSEFAEFPHLRATDVPGIYYDPSLKSNIMVVPEDTPAPKAFVEGILSTKRSRKTINYANAVKTQSWTNEQWTEEEAIGYKRAMDKEMATQISKGTYLLVDRESVPPGVSILTNRWLHVRKEQDDGSLGFKSRLVIGGHRQKEGIDYNETSYGIKQHGSCYH